jgi:nucleotide-binding universal stress UspA family protein
MFHRILVAIDHTESSPFVFEQAFGLAQSNRSALMLQSVLALLDDTYSGDSYLGIPQSALPIYIKKFHDLEETGIGKLRMLESQSTAAGIPTEITQSIGDPGELICALAGTWNADLIVMGRRGLNGLHEFFMGSVSNYVLHHAPCHVLVIQDKLRTQSQATKQEVPVEAA